MLTYLRDLYHTAQLKARYRRRLQEQLLNLAESSYQQPASEDPSRWTLINQSLRTSAEHHDLRTQARKLVHENPHARNLLRLLEIYVAGPGLKLTHVPNTNPTTEQHTSGPSHSSHPSNSSHPLAEAATHLWTTFLQHNHRHYTYGEHARRAWRDGEAFLRLFPTPTWPPTVRFLDPEHVGPTTDHPNSQGILTEPEDVETPIAYLRINPQSGELLEHIPASDLLHTRINADSNQKRGTTLFTPILDTLAHFERWLETELTARRLQASIVLWRKVQGSPAQAAAFAEALQSSSDSHNHRREKVRPGTILTTSQGTDLQYLQPDTNFGDAVPLGRLLLLSIAAGGGVPEFMLTSDASNSNFASTMVAEGPAVKLFQAEQQFFAAEFRQLWQWVMRQAIHQGYLPEDFFDQIQPDFTFPQLINRDRPRERLADARLIESGVLSRSEVARREGVDPKTMQNELQNEQTPNQSQPPTQT